MYRPHRLLLDESLEEAVEIKDLNELAEKIGKNFWIKYYHYDDRLKKETWIVLDINGAVGFIT